MTKIDFEDVMQSLTEMLEEKTADYLDVNRKHIRVFAFSPNIIGEDIINWDNDPDDAAEGKEYETYYSFAYQYRKDTKRLDWEEPVGMVWFHKDNNYDEVMTVEEFEKRFESKKTNICSELWYEGE